VLDPRDRIPTLIALLIVAVLVGVTIRFNIFVPFGTDSAAYITAAHQWVERDLFKPASFSFWAPWSADGLVETPFGSTPGPIKGTLVGSYPLGYPILLAAALKLGGMLAPYAVAPLFAGLLAWCAYVLASELSGPWAGVIASLLIAASPVTVVNSVSPMSDVPAAALWALAWVMVLRPGTGAAAAAGAAAAVAVMVRPYHAPLALAIAPLIFLHGTAADRWRRALVFVAFAALGPALVLWSQAVLYGSPFKLGYSSVNTFFSLDRVANNLVAYPRWLGDLHTWLPLVGLVSGPALVWRLPRRSSRPSPRAIALVAVAIILINYALYLPYTTFQGWGWLRFLLPALLALFVLAAATVDRLRVLLASRARVLGTLAFLPVVVIVGHPRHILRDLIASTAGYRALQMMGEYVREVLPPNAVVLTSLQSGAVSFYTQRPIARLDVLTSRWLDTAIDDLLRRGYRPVFVIDEAADGPSFHEQFQKTRYGQLDWPPRAEFWSGPALWYLDISDRDRFLNGERWPIDLVKFPPEAPFNGSPVFEHPTREVLFPPMHELLAFRRTLEEKYRRGLGRGASGTHVGVEQSVKWMRRYLRYRLHSCDHDAATMRVLTQLDGGDVLPLCGRARDFPPRNEVLEFRRRLEDKFKDEKKAPSTPTFVDLEGDAIWLEEYLRYRTRTCSHEDAVERVMQQIDGRAAAPGC